MDKLKQWVALTVVGCLAVVAGGWFLLVAPKRSEAADLRTQAVDEDSHNESLRTQLAMLKARAKDLPKQQAKLAAVAAKIPENPALPALIRALDSASAEAGVELVSIAPGAPTAVTPPAAAAPVAPGTTTVVAPAGGAAGTLSGIPVAINVVGGYFEVQQFMSGLEGLSRALRVTALTLAPGANPVAAQSATAASADDGKTLTATITGSVFMAVGAVQPAVTTPVAPGAAAVLPATPATAPASVPGAAAPAAAAVPATPAK